MTHPAFNNVRVVGMYFREKEGVPARELISNFVPPVELTLEREPENRFDEYAIKVLYSGHHIGYLEAASAAFIAPYLDDGIAYTCSVVDLEERKNNLHPVCNVTPAA